MFFEFFDDENILQDRAADNPVIGETEITDSLIKWGMPDTFHKIHPLYFAKCLTKAKIKEAILVEKLKRYEVPKVQGPVAEPDTLTGEERFYMKKMAQKRSNYVPVGRRGVFGGVILNMHLHWKKHETVEVICKPCKAGQVHEYAREIARLSGGTPIKKLEKTQ